MGHQLRLLMTETSPELCRLCQMSLPSHHIDVTVCPRNGPAAYTELVRLAPDAMLMDVFMPGLDAFALKKKYEQAVPDGHTIFYVTGPFQNENIEKEVMESGFAFYFLKPFDVQVLASRLLQDANKKAPPRQEPAPTLSSSFEEENMVTDMLRVIGVPAHIKGYRFLRDSILMVIESPISSMPSPRSSTPILRRSTIPPHPG